MPKVLISDKMSPKAAEIFKENGIDVDVITGQSPEELAKILPEYDGLAIRSSTTLTKELIAVADNLKVVGRAGIGVDNVNIPECTSNGIVVMNTPFGNSITTAEHAIAMMFAVARKIPQANESTHKGLWEKSKFMGAELAFKTLGLIGAGNIGAIVADRAQGLKMRVVAFDPYLTQERADELNLEKVELDELLARADFITLHTPLTDGTRNILGKENLAKTKKGVRIVNCARGGLIDEDALKEGIESGHIAGAALDVYAKEPAKENVLFGMEQVVCTPHLGASTSEAQENVAIQVAEQLSDYLNKGTVTNALNIPSVSAEEAVKLKPYITLGEQIGSFAGQICESGITKVEIAYEGAAAEISTKPVTAVLLKGLLEPIIEGVNMINAPVIAKDRDIEIAETTLERSGDYQTLITLTITTDNQTRIVRGTLFKNEARLVEVGDIKLEATLTENMLYIVNEDKPGLIGDLGKVLGDKKINIANFHLGRNDAKNDAIALIEIDQAIDEATLTSLNGLPSVKAAKLLTF